MTEAEARSKVVSTAKKYLCCKESDGSFKRIIDIYNGHKPLARGYAVQYTDEWCATYVSAIAILCGYTDIMPTECSCSKMIELHRKLGQWQESDSYTPKPGDIIMYDWQDSGAGENTGAPDHVGIVVSVSGSYMQIIEGNKGEAVAYRNMKVNGRYIRGYCLPDYASKATKASAPAESAVKKPGNTVDPAMSFSKTFAKTYTVTAGSGLNMRSGASTAKSVIKVLKNGDKFTCYGYYTQKNGTVWLLGVDRAGVAGFCSKKYLK